MSSEENLAIRAVARLLGLGVLALQYGPQGALSAALLGLMVAGYGFGARDPGLMAASLGLSVGATTLVAIGWHLWVRFTWSHVAWRLRLSPEDQPVKVDPGAVICGTRDGAPISIRVHRGLVSTELRIWVGLGFRAPWEEIASRGPERGRALMGDPVLDNTLRVYTDQPEAARALLVNESVRGALLTVLHPRPKAKLTCDGALLRVPPMRPFRRWDLEQGAMVEALLAAVDEALALVEALEGALEGAQ